MYNAENFWRKTKLTTMHSYLRSWKANFLWKKMVKKHDVQSFPDQMYSTPPKKKWQKTNEIVYNHFDDFWSIDFLDMLVFWFLNYKGYRHFLVAFDKFSKTVPTVPLKKKSGQTKTDEFLKINATSKRKPNNLEADRVMEFSYSIFHSFAKFKNYTNIFLVFLKKYLQKQQDIKEPKTGY